MSTSSAVFMREEGETAKNGIKIEVFFAAFLI
jgi:hypothetical protein